MISEEQIKLNILKNYAPWANVKSESLKIIKMTGITNLTFKVEADGVSQALIYRKFGESKENLFLSRDQETHVYQGLSISGDGPKVYFCNQQFRLQQFIESTVLEPKYMLTPGYLQEVAYSLNHFHKNKMISEHISKESFVKKTFINQKDKFLKICHDKLNKNIYSNDEQKIVEMLKHWITEDEISFIQKLLSKYQDIPLVFSHNDLLALNVLIRKQDGRFIFIDYQYAGFNFPFCDIAGYFQESKVDYDVKEHPFFSILQETENKKQMELRFIDAYLVANDTTRQQFKNQFEQRRKDPKYVKQREYLLANLGVGRMLVSFMWGLWAVIASKNPAINFDYILFAEWRYQNYLNQKKKLIG